MSHIKGNTELLTQKGKIYQTKTVSDKDLPTTNNDVTLTLHLNKYIEQYQINDIENFIKQEKPSQNILNLGINFLLKKYKYNPGSDFSDIDADNYNFNFYKILDLLLKFGASSNICIIYNSSDNSKFNIPNISEKDNVSLLMFGIIVNDAELINVLLKYNPNLDHHDSFGRTPIFYAIMYNHNDSTKILNILIKNKANINSTLKIQISKNTYEIHSPFTLSCSYDLPRITKCLLDSYVNVDYKIIPSGDTGLHICTKNGKEKVLQVLLSCDRINPCNTNKEGKTAMDLIPDNERKNDIMKLFNNFINNMNNKNHNNINGSNYNNYQQQIQINSFNNNIINKKYININNNITPNNNENINNNDNYKVFMNSNGNINMMSNNLNINNNLNNNNNENNSFNGNMDNSNNTSNDSSYSSDEMKNSKEKNKGVQKNNNYFPQYHYNKYKLLNKKIYNNLLQRKNNNNFNIEIPIDIIKKKNSFSKKYNSLNNFISPKINATPLLNLDISNKSFYLEIKLKELELQVKEKEEKEKEYTKKNDELETEKDDKEIIFERNIKEFEKINESINENEKRIKKLNEALKELKNKIPKGKFYEGTKKGNKMYKELKFEPYQIEEPEMFKILNKDLIDHQKYITETINKKIPYLDNYINEIKEIINEKTQDYEIQIYGSYANGLCMPWSDLDLVLVNKNSNNNNAQDNNNIEYVNENILIEQNNDLQSDSASIANTDSTRETFNTITSQTELLYYIFQKLKNKSWIKQQSFVENLSVKILRISLSEQNSNMSNDMYIDISIENEKHNGLKCVNLVKSYLKEYPALKPITIALKAILHSANLHNSSKGGLSSYGLILMVVSYIQSQKEYFDLKNDQDINGKIFYGFLKHYGIYFDFNKYLILTYPINETNVVNNDKESHLNINQFSQEFIILDPLNSKNNVANSSFQFMNLKMAFMIAYMVTKEDCDCGCHYGKAVYENSFNSTEHSYLKRMLNSVRIFQN